MKPSDFYVGVIDVFSILLPGAVVAWIGWRWFGGPGTVLNDFLPEGETPRWAAFLVASFCLGHIVFLAASIVDATFNPFRKTVLQRFKNGSHREQDANLLEAATALRKLSLGRAEIPQPVVSRELTAWAAAAVRASGATVWPSEIVGPDATNTYQWSRAVLRARIPVAYGDVQRLEADSKFFRSLFLVLLLATPAVWWSHSQIPVWLCGLLAALCYWRYAELRQKGINEAYRGVVVLFTSPPGPPQKPAKDPPT